MRLVRNRCFNIRRYCLAICLLLGLNGAAIGADAKAGKRIAEGVCANCHGNNGISTSGTIPNLAGQKRVYLESALIAYKQKQRTNGMANMMSSFVVNLTKEDIKNVALYYSQL